MKTIRRVPCLSWIALPVVFLAVVSANLPPAGALMQIQAASTVAGSQLYQETYKNNFSLKVNVDLVTVDAVVRDRSGAYVGNLRAEDFVVHDNVILYDPGYNSLGSKIVKVAPKPSLPQILSESQNPPQLPPPAEPQVPTIRVEVKQVLVPVIVTDAKGHSATGLRAADFRIFEDDIEQKIVACSTEADGADRLFPPAAVTSEKPALTIENKSQPSGIPQTRAILIAIDTLNSEFSNFSAVRGALKKMFRDDKTAGSMYALVTLGRNARVVQSWTTDNQALLRALDDKGFNKTILESEQSNLAAQDAQLVRMLEAYCAKNPCPSGGNPPLHDPDLMAIRSFAATSSELRAIKIKDYLQQLRGMVEQLGRCPGKRTLILFSDGFTVQPGRDLFDLIIAYIGASKVFQSPIPRLNSDMQEVLRAAQERDTAFYTIDSRGLYVFPEGEEVSMGTSRPARKSAQMRPQIQQQKQMIASEKSDGLSELAAQTGGLFYRNDNDMLSGIRQAIQDGKSYYVLSYISSNPLPDGKFRNIKVEVNGKQLIVRSKPGYWAPDK
jgi:VWFA-related protein